MSLQRVQPSRTTSTNDVIANAARDNANPGINVTWRLGDAFPANGERTLDQVRALGEICDFLMCYRGDPALLTPAVLKLRTQLVNRPIQVPLLARRDKGGLVVRFGVDPDATKMMLTRLTQQAIPAYLPHLPPLRIDTTDSPIARHSDGLLSIAGETLEESYLAPCAECRGDPVRTFWTRA